MKISILSVFPEMHHHYTATSIIGKAVEQGLISFDFIKFSDLCEPKERIDEPTCGPGVGMIIKPLVVEKAIEQAEQRWGKGFKVFFSPHGTVLSQPLLRHYASEFFLQATNPSESATTHSAPEPHLILICGRYEGIDERVETHYADAIISIGDYVVMGGDLPAQVFLEAFLRLLPGVIGKHESVEQDSFESPLLDYPHYGLPVEWQGAQVPEVLRSGNHAEIAAWRKKAALKRTITQRFDWFVSQQPTQDDIAKAWEFIPSHYVAVMHTQVLVKSDNNTTRVGETSIPSLDIHDVARSCASYGITNFFIVSPLIDQQEIVSTFMNFWLSAEGAKYNTSRQHAVSSIKQAYSYQEMISMITAKEGKRPLVVATSARPVSGGQQIDYFSQKIVWEHNRPILLLFGTGQGLSDELLELCDYILCPVNGLTNYNHLSVRSAVAIILDRWLGLHPQLKLVPKKGSQET